jgi:signal peptidase
MVSGKSMEPTLRTGDLVVVHAQEGYAPGDIVAFQVDGGNVIHRIVGGSAAEGFVTQGDNKSAPDPWRPKPSEILGKLWLHVPGAGRTVAYLRQPAPFATLVGGLAALLLLGGAQARRRRRRRREMANAEHEKRGGGAAAYSGLPAALGAALVLALAFAAGAFFLFRQPAERTQFVERLRYEREIARRLLAKARSSRLCPPR